MSSTFVVEISTFLTIAAGGVGVFIIGVFGFFTDSSSGPKNLIFF